MRLVFVGSLVSAIVLLAVSLLATWQNADALARRADARTVAYDMRRDIQGVWLGSLYLAIIPFRAWAAFRHGPRWQAPLYAAALLVFFGMVAAQILPGVFACFFLRELYADLNAGGVTEPIPRSLHSALGSRYRMLVMGLLGGAGMVWVCLWSYFNRDRLKLFRQGVKLCRHCGYALTGLQSERCPECGTPVKEPPPQWLLDEIRRWREETAQRDNDSAVAGGARGACERCGCALAARDSTVCPQCGAPRSESGGPGASRTP